jgi:outer membrane protein, multidrug efflux system
MHQRRLALSASMRKNRLRHAALFVVCLALAPSLGGCLVTGYEKPDLALEIPDKYKAENGDKAPPALDWWRGFHSAELTDFIEKSEEHNFDIAVAIAQLEQADALVRVTGAALLPTVDAGASATESRNASSGGLSSTGGSTSATTLYSTNLTASYVLDVWGKNRAALLATQESAVASRYNREVVTLTTITTVADTYFQILAAQDELRVAHDNETAAGRILDLLKQQFNAGTVSQLDVSQQEALLAQVRASIPPLNLVIRQNTAALALLVGRAPEHVGLKGGSLTRLAVPHVTPGLPSAILTQRPDVRQAEAQLSSANYNVESARAAFFPTIQLTAETGFQSLALSSLFGPGAWFYTATQSLAQPVFDGFQLLGQLDEEIALQKQALQSYRKSVISAFVNVEQALIAIEEDTRQERLQAEVVTASRRAFELSEAQLRAGTVNLITVLQAEQTLFTAETTLAQVRLARFEAVVSMFQALGGGWPPKAELALAANERAVEVNKPELFPPEPAPNP